MFQVKFQSVGCNCEDSIFNFSPRGLGDILDNCTHCSLQLVVTLMTMHKCCLCNLSTLCGFCVCCIHAALINCVKHLKAVAVEHCAHFTTVSLLCTVPIIMPRQMCESVAMHASKSKVWAPIQHFRTLQSPVAHISLPYFGTCRRF